MRIDSRWACLLGLAIAGCGGGAPTSVAPEEKGQAALNEVGELYRLYTFGQKKPPQGFADFKALEAVNPAGYDAIKVGKVVVRYGATMTALEEGPPSGTSDEVLAYEKSVPESGGQVLMLDRSVRRMTADEFKAAKKAGKD